MNYKLKIDYKSILFKCIYDKELASQIQTNIDFVEKYIDQAETIFVEEKEQQIMYKQLAIIAFSCVEALWKGIVLTINNNCNNNHCKENRCKYKKFNNSEKLNRANVNEIAKHLQRMRVISIFPFEQAKIEELQNMRNHVHLTRIICDSIKSEDFNKVLVDDMLRLYYVTLNQMECSMKYLPIYAFCIKDLDENGYSKTDKLIEKENKEYITNKICCITPDLFYNKPLKESDTKILKKLHSQKNYNQQELADYIGRWLYYESAHFKEESDYQTVINNLFTKLSEYISEDNTLIKEIKENIERHKNIMSNQAS